MICVPINFKKFKSVLETAKKAEKVADIIEIWFDEITDLDAEKLEKLRKTTKTPIIYKTTSFKHADIVKNIDYVDFDISIPAKTMSKIKGKKIISYHNFEATPSLAELKKIVTRLIKEKPHIIKIATTAKSLDDSMRMLSLLSSVSKKQKSIFLCMGKHGEITRTTGHLFGNFLTFAPLEAKYKTADGQIPLKQLKDIRKLI